MNKYLVCILLGMLVFTTSCCKEPEPEDPFTRTILVYLGRDNNLYVGSEEKIDAILQGWDGRKGNLVFFEDKYGTAPCLMEAYSENGVNKTRLLETYEDVNSADAAVFAGVVKNVQEMYPSDSYGLILFSHATGWLPPSAKNLRSILVDGKEEMDLTDFAAAIPDHAFDFIIFEACFMAGIEVAYELKDKTDYIVASSAEILSPGFRTVYPQTVSYLFQKEPDLQSFIRQAYAYVAAQSGAFQSATFSLINTAALPALRDWVSEHVAGPIAVDPAELQHFDRYTTHQFFDFGDYFSRAVSDPLQKDALADLLDACVPYKVATPSFMLSYRGFLIEKHSGLTTYIDQPLYPSLGEAYKKLKWYQDALATGS